MGYYVFGYGSLINPESVALTLGRKINHKELRPVEIIDYCRSWNMVIPVIITDEIQKDRIVNSVFLDLQKLSCFTANGVIFKVKSSELENMDIREKQYSRIDVTSNITNREINNDLAIFTYVGKPGVFRSELFKS